MALVSKMENSIERRAGRELPRLKANEIVKDSEFRNWVRLLWLENIQETEGFGQTPYPLEEYWSRYKYWLKREFKYQRGRK